MPRGERPHAPPRVCAACRRADAAHGRAGAGRPVTSASAAGGIVRGMRAKRWSLSVPLDGFTLAEHGAHRARGGSSSATRTRGRSRWTASDCFTPLAAVAVRDRDARGHRHRQRLHARARDARAQSAAGLGGGGARPLPARHRLGLAADRGDVERRRFAKPVTRVREMAQFLRRALAGERVVFHGETLLRGRLPPHAAARPSPCPSTSPRCGRACSRLAGEVGDGVHHQLAIRRRTCASPSQVVREAAEKAGRDPDSHRDHRAPLDQRRPARARTRTRSPCAATSTAYPQRPRLPRLPRVARPHRSARTDVGRLGDRRSQGGGRRRSRRGRGRPHHPRIDAARSERARAALSGRRRG